MKNLLITFGLSFCWFTALEAAQPNVLFILADDLGIGQLGCFGTDWLETPNIDRLCSQGIKCTGGLAAYPTCKPSRAVILTGQYGSRTGVTRVVDRHLGQENQIRFLVPENRDIPPETVTLAKPFRAAGYATAMYGKWHISHEGNPATHPLQYGFDEAIESHQKHYNATAIPPVDLPAGTTMEKLLTDRAISFIERSAATDQPFFLYMPYFWVHGPLEADAGLIEHFRKKLASVELSGTKPESVAVIAAMTKMFDNQVGRLLAAIEKLSLEQNTIVVFTSDNGAFNENLVGGYRGQKGQTYDGGMRVPYIFKWPGRIEAGSETAERMIGADLFPTLLSLANIPRPENHLLDGIDLAPLLLGKVAVLPERDMFCYYPKYAQFNRKTGRWRDSWRNVVYSGKYKLIEYPEYDEYELFNLKMDPQEQTNLVGSNPEKRADLMVRLHRWLKETDAEPPIENPDYTLD
jgi:arylsulfatase A-like enzyme